MKNITIRQMRIFESVSRHLSYSRAAEDLHLTQPAVSMQIKQMEDQAGLPLFLHIGKRISLTETGKLILHHCRVILADMRAAEQSLSALADGSMQHLRIGLITSASYFFPRLINAFLQARGGIELNMTVRNREQLISLLRNDEIDVAVMVQPPGDYILSAEPFAQNPFVLVASPAHPLSRETNIPLSRIVSERLIVRENGTDTRNVANEIFCGREAVPRLMELGCEEAIKQSVMAEMGISFLSTQAVQSEVRAGLLTILDVQGFPVERQWHLARRTDRQLPSAARSFRDFLLAEASARLACFMGIDSVQMGIDLPHFIHTSQEMPPANVTSPNVEMARRTRELLRSNGLPDEHHVQRQDHAGSNDRRSGDLVGSSKLSHH